MPEKCHSERIRNEVSSGQGISGQNPPSVDGKNNAENQTVTEGQFPELEECLELLLNHAKGQPIVEIPTAKAYGMVSAKDILSSMMVPPFPKSAMDGYAVKSSEIQTATKESPVKLKVAGELFAGDYAEIPHTSMSAVRVMTGSYIPDEFDAVVKQEDTDYGEDVVSIFSPVKSFQNYCKVGEDIKNGDLLVPKGTRLNALHLGLLASAGIGEVSVIKPLSVAIICTGSELSPLGTPLPKGKIYNSISHILSAGIEKEGFNVNYTAISTDNEAELSAKLKAALDVSDIVITTGGVSVGKKDIVPNVLKSIGAEILFTHANIQPGTPTVGSVLDGKIILSLSGNPYAAIANFEYYFWAVAAHLMQNESFSVKCENANLADEYPKTNSHRRMIRARAENGKVYLPSNVHASSVIQNLTGCNCFIDLEPERAIHIGDTVRIRYFKEI